MSFPRRLRLDRASNQQDILYVDLERMSANMRGGRLPLDKQKSKVDMLALKWPLSGKAQ